MNKRQIKKMNTFKNKETKTLVKVDLTNVSDNAHIDVYVSNRFEVTRENERWVGTEGHDKKISVTKALAKGKDCVAYFLNGANKKHSATIYLSKTHKSYYIIRKTNPANAVEV
ncbi:hypothetical protein [Priestia megaterium]|uniref:hypothetical protein n=1 Tax=Priestia megaterium TaxID=1404 RepID=UPI0028775869|nr:hypothetical protein [Priestia megaterium]